MSEIYVKKFRKLLRFLLRNQKKFIKKTDENYEDVFKIEEQEEDNLEEEFLFNSPSPNQSESLISPPKKGNFTSLISDLEEIIIKLEQDVGRKPCESREKAQKLSEFEAINCEFNDTKATNDMNYEEKVCELQQLINEIRSL